MDKAFENRLDFDFARRLFLSGVISTIIGISMMAFLLIPLLTVFGGMGPIVILAIFCVIIGGVGDFLRLVPFPITHLLSGDLSDQKRQEVISELRHSGYALPLSFVASTLWLMMVFDFAFRDVPFFALFCAVPPVTILVMLVCTACDSPREAFRNSTKAFLIVFAAMLVVAPEGLERTEKTPPEKALPH